MNPLPMEIEFTILMPCLNEEETLEKCILKAKESIRRNGLTAEILIADNASADQSVTIAENQKVRIVKVKEKGYGNTLKKGIKEAKGKYIIMGDSDCSYDFEEISLFIEKLRSGYELVIGNRFKGGITKGAMPFLHRYLGNPILSFIGRSFFHVPIGDFHCGLRGFNRESILNLNLSTTGMEFASEMIVKASLKKLRLCEVPTILHPDERTRTPHLRTWHDGWRHLRFLLIYTPQWLFLYPGIFMILAGSILSGILVFNQVSINHINFDVHTLLYSITFFYIGFQFISFYIFTRYFGINNGFLPQSLKFNKILNLLKLERSILIGIFFIILGIYLSVHALLIWKQNGFGELNPSQVFRIVIPATFALIIGIQLILNSFFLSILGINKNPHFIGNTDDHSF